jgi:hypothetical protein
VAAYRATGDVPRDLAQFTAELPGTEWRWRILQHITASPGKTGDIARAALVLTHFEHGYVEWTSLSLHP